MNRQNILRTFESDSQRIAFLFELHQSIHGAWGVESAYQFIYTFFKEFRQE